MVSDLKAAWIENALSLSLLEYLGQSFLTFLAYLANLKEVEAADRAALVAGLLMTPLLELAMVSLFADFAAVCTRGWRLRRLEGRI